MEVVVIEYGFAFLLMILVLIDPKSSIYRLLRSLLLNFSIGACFYLASPILGYAFFFFGGISAAVRSRTKEQKKESFYHIKGKGLKWKFLSGLSFLMTIVLISWKANPMGSFDSGLGEQDLLLLALLIFGATSVIGRGKKWNN